MVTFDIDTKGVEGFKFLNPVWLKGQSVIGVILARSVDGHDEDIFSCVVGLVEMTNLPTLINTFNGHPATQDTPNKAFPTA